ncbi:MAG: hypothetical protein AMJ73_08070 [candidate division Zixibacteria bacterium SM1_73]|nr:MAG: hypothetical protein AMJ73_08070 [candidate division Zixibacteria bacterium SM1_73]
MQIKIGCCGFPVSRGKYYKSFRVVEIQQTFYQPPEEKTVLKWRNEAPDNFEFSLKVWQLITHEPSSPTYRRLKFKIPESKKKNYGFFKPTDEVWEAWEKTERVAQILKSKIIVFQCPPRFEPNSENKKNFGRFFKTVKRKNCLLVWEPRERWEREEICSLCEKLDLVPCIDPFGNEPLPCKIGYFRLHGKTGYRYKYTDSDLEELKKIARYPLERDSPRTPKSYSLQYFMFNNVFMFEDALRFKKIMAG